MLYTTDLHGHILSTPSRNFPQGAGGLLRCATLIGQIRAQQKNVLLLDNGDTVQGSAESWLTGGRVMIRALEWLKFDAWNFGNHEFDWGLPALVRLHDATTLTMLGANISAPAGGPSPLAKVQPFIVREFDGVRVAVVGMTNPGIPTWIRPELLDHLTFAFPIRTLSRLLPAVREERPDILLLLIHEGWMPTGDTPANEIRGIARQFPELDAILGGHLHETVPGLAENGVLFMDAGCHGAQLGRLDLVYDTARKKVVHRSSTVLAVTNQPPECAALRDFLGADLPRAERYLDKLVGRTDWRLSASSRTPGQSPVQQLLCRAIAKAVRADIVVHGVLSESGLPVGPIRQRDIWRLVPYENRIGVAWLTLPELHEILEENAAQSSQRMLGVYGVKYDLYPPSMNNPPAPRVRNLRLADDSQPPPTQRLAVALNSHTLASGGGRHPSVPRLVAAPQARFILTTNDTRSAVIEYIRHHSPLRIANPPLVQVIQ
ncbi:MAG: bifunctional UDP-sugar hydrolase/5'-nucleotidase [Kiritimatiellaeota bacterium]|nr:bifunctional UDP-sugar hydrolase/5'-nucleotidase [Kiritimatiellota bacterium]